MSVSGSHVETPSQNAKDTGQRLNLNSSEIIYVPSPDSRKRMAIRFTDWERIKRNISMLKENTSNLPVFYSILFGISGTSWLTIIPLYYSQGLSPWVIPLYTCIAIFSLICGSVFVWVDHFVNINKKSKIEYIESDIKDIEKVFQENNKLTEDSISSTTCTI